jgi:hypothetical protein
MKLRHFTLAGRRQADGPGRVGGSAILYAAGFAAAHDPVVELVLAIKCAAPRFFWLG